MGTTQCVQLQLPPAAQCYFFCLVVSCPPIDEYSRISLFLQTDHFICCDSQIRLRRSNRQRLFFIEKKIAERLGERRVQTLGTEPQGCRLKFRLHVMELRGGQQEALTPSILMAQIWKPPDVAKPNAESHLSQEILDFTVPSRSSDRLRRALLAAGAALRLRRSGSGIAVIRWQGLLLHLMQEGPKDNNNNNSHDASESGLWSSTSVCHDVRLMVHVINSYSVDSLENYGNFSWRMFLRDASVMCDLHLSCTTGVCLSGHNIRYTSSPAMRGGGGWRCGWWIGMR